MSTGKCMNVPRLHLHVIPLISLQQTSCSMQHPHVSHNHNLEHALLTSPTTPTSPQVLHSATRAHLPQHEGEMKLSVGDVIANVKELGNGWALGQNLTRDRLGVFPSDHVDVLAPGDTTRTRALDSNSCHADARAGASEVTSREAGDEERRDRDRSESGARLTQELELERGEGTQPRHKTSQRTETTSTKASTALHNNSYLRTPPELSVTSRQPSDVTHTQLDERAERQAAASWQQSGSDRQNLETPLSGSSLMSSFRPAAAAAGGGRSNTAAFEGGQPSASRPSRGVDENPRDFCETRRKIALKLSPIANAREQDTSSDDDARDVSDARNDTARSTETYSNPVETINNTQRVTSPIYIEADSNQPQKPRLAVKPNHVAMEDSDDVTTPLNEQFPVEALHRRPPTSPRVARGNTTQRRVAHSPQLVRAAAHGSPRMRTDSTPNTHDARATPSLPTTCTSQTQHTPATRRRKNRSCVTTTTRAPATTTASRARRPVRADDSSDA